MEEKREDIEKKIGRVIEQLFTDEMKLLGVKEIECPFCGRRNDVDYMYAQDNGVFMCQTHGVEVEFGQVNIFYRRGKRTMVFENPKYQRIIADVRGV